MATLADRLEGHRGRRMAVQVIQALGPDEQRMED